MKQLAHVRHNRRLKAEHGWVLRTIYWKLLCSASSVRISSPKARRSAKAPQCPAQSQSWARSTALKILTPRQILTSDPPSEYVCSITLKGTGASTFPVGFHVQKIRMPRTFYARTSSCSRGFLDQETTARENSFSNLEPHAAFESVTLDRGTCLRGGWNALRWTSKFLQAHSFAESSKVWQLGLPGGFRIAGWLQRPGQSGGEDTENAERAGDSRSTRRSFQCRANIRNQQSR